MTVSWLSDNSNTNTHALNYKSLTVQQLGRKKVVAIVPKPRREDSLRSIIKYCL